MTTTQLTVPDIGGAADVDVIEILVKVGDRINIDSPLVTLESDKATMDLPATAAGVIKEIKVKVGDKVAQGSVIAVVDSAEASAATAPSASATQAAPAAEKQPEKPAPRAAAPVAPSSPAAEKAPSPVASSVTSAPSTSDATDSKEIHAGPAVRKLAREFGVNLSDVNPSGPKERIVVEDLQAYVKARLAQAPAVPVGNGLPAAPIVDFAKFGTVEMQPLTRIKKLTGKNLHRNWLLVPHVTQFGAADITLLEEFRTANKAPLEKQNIKLTPLVFIMRAVAAALKKFPTFNASLDADGEQLILKKYIHIGVAVDTPEGLVVPVIRDVDCKGLADLAKELSVVSEKARQKQLMPADMQGGCFSISSLGGIGGTAFTPIVNLPEVAILGVSKASYQPIYQDGQFVPRLMLPLSLSYDHRVIDGAEGARFITYLSHVLADIRNLLL